MRCEVRVVGDEEKAIVDALNALWHRCTYERGAPAHDAHPQGRILNKVFTGRLASGNVIVMAQAKRAAEDMLERVRRAQSSS